MKGSPYMRNKVFIFVFVLNSITISAFGQLYEAPEIRLKTALPSIFNIDNVRQVSEKEGESELSISIVVKKGKIESVSRDGGYWIVTVRSSSKEASTYLIKDSQFKIAGEESKKVIINAIHWKDGN